jgi:hypothetical protein
MKICPVGAEFFHADLTNLIVAFHNFANIRKSIFLGRKKYWMGICPPPQAALIITSINMAVPPFALSAIWFYL